MKNFDVLAFCCSSGINGKKSEISFIYKFIYFVTMRKKSIICSCGLQDESVNMFLITILSFANSLGWSCIFYYTWISFSFKAPLIPNQSLQNCLSGHFWKTGFLLYDPQKRQHSKKSSVYVRNLVRSVSWVYFISQWHWQFHMIHKVAELPASGICMKKFLKIHRKH